MDEVVAVTDPAEQRTYGIHTEDNFTPSRPDCPYPQRWHARDADSTELEVSALVAAFVGATQPELVVETGTAFGDTALLIGRALFDNGHGRLVTLEPDAERADYARQLCVGVPVEVLQMPSLSYEPPEKVGFAWFDSLIELRIPEFMHFRQFMDRGTMVGFHDCGWHRAEFREKLEVLCARGYMRAVMPHTPRGVCFAQVL